MKPFLLAAALFLSVAISAQVPVSLGVKAGANLSNFSKGGLDARFGFNAGLTADINFAPSMYVLTGLEFTMKGAKYKEGGAKITHSPMYLQLPIHFGYKLEVMPGTNLVFRAGPYMAYGIAGKSKMEGAGIFDYDRDFFSGGTKKFEVGLGGGVGAEFGKIGVTLGYDHALTKVWDSGAKNHNAYLSLGYKF